MDTNILNFNTNQKVTHYKFLLLSTNNLQLYVNFWYYRRKNEPQHFSQTYINILTHFTNLVHCPQIQIPIFKVIDKILAAV